MTTYVYRNGELIEKHLVEHDEDKRSPLGAPMIISDSMAPIRSMADGKMHDSKSSYLKGVHNAGCRVVGNDRLDAPAPKALPRAGHDIKRAIQQLS